MTDYTKMIVNGLYDGAVLSALTILNSIILDKMLKMAPDSPKTSTSLKKFGSLTVAVSAAVLEKDMLEQRNVIPVDPYSPYEPNGRRR